MLKKQIIKIKGIHCASCKTLIETEIDVLPGVNKVDVNYLSEKAILEFDETKVSLKKIFKEIKKLNYEPSLIEDSGSLDKEQDNSSSLKPLLFGLLIPLGLVALVYGYAQVKKFGGFELLAQLNEGNVSYGIIFVIGLLAGFHCVGMCGGLVVAYSSNSLNSLAPKVIH